MRTTLTLDEDVAAKLRDRARRTGQSFKAVVNQALRAGLNARRTLVPDRPFKVQARELGLRPAYSYDNVAELLEQLEGPSRR